MKPDYDIVIVGAGVIGYSIAFRLMQNDPGLSLAVVGDPANSLMASRAAAGMLAPYGECEKADAFFEFCRESLNKYPAFIQSLEEKSGQSVYFSQAGSVMPESQFGERWDERIRFFEDQNIAYQVWDKATVRSRLPGLSENCGRVIWTPEAQVNNRQMHDALKTASVKAGVHTLWENVTGFRLLKDRIESAITDNGEIVGRKIVIAAGSWSPQLGKILGVSVPLKPIKGQMCRLAVEDDALGYTVHGKMTYIAPWREGFGFVVGSTMEDRGYDPSVESDVIQDLIERASQILPCLSRAPLLETWTGLRPAPQDMSPIMGRSARYENLYYSTGHYRNGILQTPNQSDYLADTILKSNPVEIPEFSPARYDL
ncbi:MAG: FAD-dependent oxidoreductase [Candidatus Nitrohelix vancouverensis]|uniref:FAD-dependent oxidoreductase n=1 Tax=Candidatus Nitrohelix vancouverensis TaxID=2705534 RepID=A0A7T0C4D1_9BACT|nr:MAG: FAD-dependent oxidoreductase [Candidatus Nitrohelix vancouverensis]